MTLSGVTQLTCYTSYDIPVVKDTVTYADSLLKSYALTAAALARAEAVAISLYKTAGEPIQARLQGQVSVLSYRSLKYYCHCLTVTPHTF